MAPSVFTGLVPTPECLATVLLGCSSGIAKPCACKGLKDVLVAMSFEGKRAFACSVVVVKAAQAYSTSLTNIPCTAAALSVTHMQMHTINCCTSC